MAYIQSISSHPLIGEEGRQPTKQFGWNNPVATAGVIVSSLHHYNSQQDTENWGKRIKNI